jgi:hypothetical protein
MSLSSTFNLTIATMNLTETIDYIEAEWPDILDANSCARWVIKRTGDGMYATQDTQQIDQLCCFWMRHEH